jgi:hypothetical protein
MQAHNGERAFAAPALNGAMAPYGRYGRWRTLGRTLDERAASVK